MLLSIWSVREPDADRCLCCRGRKQRGLAARVDAENLLRPGDEWQPQGREFLT